MKRHPLLPTAKRGFTMIEIIIVLAVISILAALIVPLALNQITQKRYTTCREELQLLKQAIVGDATLVAGGVRSSFGHGVLVSGRALHLKGRLEEDEHGFVLRTPSLTK